jgi:signal transduction histidine kinase
VSSTTREKIEGALLDGDTVRGREPTTFRIFEGATVLVALVSLSIGLLSSDQTIRQELIDIAAWLPVVVVADLLPVTLWKPIEMTMSLPVLLAAGMVFPPTVASLLAFVGNTDLRELRREIPLMRGLFNRSNVALSILAASWLFHRTGGNVAEWPAAIGYAFLALAADMLINNSLTFVGAHMLFARPIAEVLSEAYGRTQPTRFLLGYVCFGSMAILLSSVYLFAGNWGLIAFFIPVILSHVMFSNSSALGLASLRIRHQERAFASISDRIADERRDERLSVAAGLHDEVLPSLYKVHLMGQVIRQDLAGGRLLELDDDVPSLLEAADAANDAIRILIRDLRRSSIGPHGLRHTIHMLARQVEAEFGVTINTELQEVGGHPLSQLLAYQIAREALSNCVKHAIGSPIHLKLVQTDSDFRMVVRDEGPGFLPEAVDNETHFGLELMRERVELCGGTMVVDSAPGAGTTVVVRFPLDLPTSSR